MTHLNELELTFTRIFRAPRELVFRAFSKEELIRQWWGPVGWTMPVCTMDFRPGGEWRYCIRNAEGEEHWARAVYQEITPVEQLVFTDQITDAQGNVIAGLPAKKMTVTLTDLGGKTQLTVRVQLETAADRDKLVELGFIRGFSEALNLLEQLLLRVTQDVN